MTKKTTVEPGLTKIPADVLEVLQTQIGFANGNLEIRKQLDRAMYTKVNKVLEAMGGRWDRKAKAHVFEGDARDAMEDVIKYGEYLDAKKALQFFQTPTPLAMMLVGKAVDYLRSTGVAIDNARALEPSAGMGRIAAELFRAEMVVMMIEIARANCDALKAVAKPYDAAGAVMEADFLTIMPDRLPKFDAVVMNPPFSRLQDVTHVTHALDFVRPKTARKPGGIVVSVMSPAWTYRTDRRAAEFRSLVKNLKGVWEELPEGTFAESGTMVRTGILTIIR